jgi:hypothetical protein
MPVERNSAHYAILAESRPTETQSTEIKGQETRRKHLSETLWFVAAD